MRVRVDAAADSAQVIDEFSAAGALQSFSFGPPELSEVFLDLINGSAARHIE